MWIRKIEVGIEETILVFLILLNILDFLEILPGDIDYIKKIISWTALGLLLYHVSIVNVLFGTHQKGIDILLIVAYFSLLIKNLVGIAFVSFEEAHLLKPLYQLLITNAQTIDTAGMYIGGTILIGVSLYLTRYVEIKKPSVMAIIHEEGPPPTLRHFPVRTVSIFLVLVTFFVTIFNLMMEWLAMAVDAPLVVIGIFGYIIITFKHKEQFHATSFIYKIANIGEEFYEKCISSFHYKKTIGHGIIGLLVLHALTDVGIYIIPYLTGLQDPLYFSQLGSGHDPIPSLYLNSIAASTPLIEITGLFLLYVLNGIGITTALLYPGYIWYLLHYKKHITLPPALIALITTAYISVLITPAFLIQKITATTKLIGVDILTQRIEYSSAALLILVSIFIATRLLLTIPQEKKYIIFLLTAASLYFFTVYIYIYSTSIITYYVTLIPLLLKKGSIFIAVFLFLFLGITMLFYYGGYGVFIHTLYKNHTIFLEQSEKRIHK